jgi:hypothetical protein
MLVSPLQLGLQYEAQGNPSYFGVGHGLGARVYHIVTTFD